MMALGRIYEQGIGGTKPDFEKAFYYYDFAAQKNEPYALYWVGKQWEVNYKYLITLSERQSSSAERPNELGHGIQVLQEGI
jgi:TPR repeat protein